MAGVNSEEEFYNMYPTEEAFFQVYPQARQMANGGQPYPWSYPEYGMQGKGAGAQIPVETYYAYGGFTSNPAATLVHYNHGGSGDYAHPSNYGAFPAFAKQGGTYGASYHQGPGVQGGKIDNVVDSRKNNFLSAIQANTQNALNKEAAEEAMQINQQFMSQLIAQFGAETYNNNYMYENQLDTLSANRENKMRDFMGSIRGAVSYETDKRLKQKMYDDTQKKLNLLMSTNKLSTDAQTVPDFNPIPENMAKYGGSLKKYQTAGTTGDQMSEDIKGYAQKKYVTNTENIKSRQKLIQQLEEALLRAQQYSSDQQVLSDFGVDKTLAGSFTPYTYIDKKDWNSSSEQGEKKELKSVAELQAAIDAEKQKIEAAKTDLKTVATKYPQYYPSDVYPDLYASDNPWGFKLSEKNWDANEKQENITQSTKTQGTTPSTPSQTQQGTEPTRITGTGTRGARYTPGAQQQTTGTTTDNQMDPKEKAVKDLAVAYGQDPDQTWAKYQALTTYGTMGAGAGYPYMVNAPDYRYRRTRSSYPFAGDVGRMPTSEDIEAMQAAAGAQGYGLKVTEKKRLFGKGPRKIIIETTFNPNTGKVEETPVEQTPSPTWGVTPQTPSPLLTDQDRYNLDKEQAIREGQAYEYEQLDPIEKARLLSPIQSSIQPVEADEPSLEEMYTPTKKYGGGLHRFLPKHDMLGETGNYQGVPVTSMPDMFSYGEEGTPGMTGLPGKKTGAKSSYKRKMNVAPWAADATLTGISALTALGLGDEERAMEEQVAQRKRGDNLFKPFVGKDLGQYVPTGALTGTLGVNQSIPIQDTGYMPGFTKDKGGSIGYSDWSQTPVNGYYGVPTGEMTMYPHWTQAPVMQMGGAPSTEQYLTDKEIAEIIQMGGQVEYLD